MRGLDARVLIVAVAAACGGGSKATRLQTSPLGLVPGDAPSAGVIAAPATSALPAVPTFPPSSTAAPSPSAPVLDSLEMKPLVASAMVTDLEGLALDPKSLPPIEQLVAKTLRGVMKLFAKSLGAKCDHCHREGNFALPTPRKKVAAKMWNEFVAKLEFADGALLFCDSCHQGRTKQLVRADKKALERWMDANFVDKLRRKDREDHECETCHVDMDMRFLTKWGGGAPLN